jgi:hypothetical protein
MPGNPGQDFATQFGVIVKSELVVGPAFTAEQFVGAALAPHAPTDAFQRGEHAAALVAGQLLTQHLEGDVERGREHLAVLDRIRNHLDG